MHSQSNKDLRNNLIVRYLPLNLVEHDLHSLFSTVGTVDSVKLMRVKSGSEGYGFVNFARKEDAERAIQFFDGYQISPRKTLRVSWSVPGKRVGCKVYVTNIPIHWDEHDFERAFQAKGLAEEVKLLAKRQGRCSGFILFPKPEDARKAIELMDGVIPPNSTMPLRVEIARRNARSIHNNILARTSPSVGLPHRNLSLKSTRTISQSKKSPHKTTSHQLFFFNAPAGFPEDFIVGLFARYGTLKDVRLQKDCLSNLLGMGFVSFDNLRSLKKCFEALNGAQICNHCLRLRLVV